MGKMVIARRAGAAGKLRNAEGLLVSLTDDGGSDIVVGANACSWDDFLFHLGPVTARLRLHQADRDLRATRTTTILVDDGVVDEAWVKSFLLTAD